jgi:acetoin utilization deacetylase AcuC-like enzyme
MPPGLFLSHPSSLEHDTGAHPERADRIRAIEVTLEQRDWLGWERREAPEVDLTRVEAVHPRSHIDAVREHSSRSTAFDLDTPTSTGSWEAALHSAGGACAMVEALLGGEASTAFSAHRPPGHHAEVARAMGFCLFNNVAIAARHAQTALGLERVAILDWDVHHGNGTQAIFWDDPTVLYVSLHEWPFYPGSGGPGEGNETTVNVPLRALSGADEYRRAFADVIEPAVRAFGPDLLLVSAGFDAHLADPLANIRLSDGAFTWMAERATTLAPRVAAVLEGGYDVETLPRLVDAALEGFAA